MSFFGLFGGAKAAETVVDTAAKGIYNGIDMLKYTDEEKAIASAKATEVFLDFVKVAYDDNSIRSVTRRWLAWGIALFTLILASTAVGFAVWGKTEIVNSIIQVGEAFSVGWAFVAVVVFYFGATVLGRGKA